MITKKGGTKFNDTITKKRNNKNQEKDGKVQKDDHREGDDQG
jgi:hypothetical protein